jgi:outer membrane protein
MKGRRVICSIGRCILSGSLVWILGAGFTTSTYAREWVDLISAPFSNPLLAHPPELFNGKTLPGDDVRVQCPHNGSKTDHPLTLSAAVDLALCNNWQAKVAWANIKAQTALVGEARAAYLPTVNLGISQLSDKTSYPDPNNDTSRKSDSRFATLTWRLVDFGGRSANLRSANALLDAALASHDAVIQKTMQNVVAAYFDLQTAQSVKTSRARALDLASQTLETTQRREKRGAAAQSDTLLAMTAMAKAELDSSRALGSYEKSLTALLNAMGLAPTTDAQFVRLDEDIDGSKKSIEKDLQSWLETASDQHPAIVAARNQLQSAREKLITTRSEGLPTLDFNSNIYVNGRPNQGLTSSQSKEYITGFTINFPIFEGFSRTYKIGGALAQIEIKEAELADIRNQTLSELVKAHSDASTAFRSLGASKKLEDAALAALDSVRRRFDRGVADMIEILNVQATLTDAQQERIRALADWQSARLKLISSAGMLGRSALMK